MIKLFKQATRGLFALTLLAFLTSFNPIISKTSSAKQDYYVFFDLGEVLLTPNRAKAFFQAPGVFLSSIVKHGIPTSVSITTRMFELMDHITGLPRGSATATCDNIAVPGLMCEWMCGNISSEDFVNTVTNISPKDKFFKSKAEGKLIINAIKLMLPDNLVKTHKTTSTLKVFKKCCKHDASRVCILSNWDKSSVELLKKQFPEIFAKLKDNQIIFSCDLGCKKPDAQIYNLAAKKLGVSPHRCILVDDQAPNIIGARSCGWKGIVHNDAQETAELLHDLYGFECKA